VKEFVTDLKDRQRISRRHKERYQTDPEYRLRCVNRGRIWQGLPPRSSVDEIQSRGAE
jgi:hypothetical protein